MPATAARSFHYTWARLATRWRFPFGTDSARSTAWRPTARFQKILYQRSLQMATKYSRSGTCMTRGIWRVLFFSTTTRMCSSESNLVAILTYFSKRISFSDWATLVQCTTIMTRLNKKMRKISWKCSESKLSRATFSPWWWRFSPKMAALDRAWPRWPHPSLNRRIQKYGRKNS